MSYHQQSGAGMAAEHVRLYGRDMSPLVRRFRHVRFAVMCAMEVPQRSPQADARLFDDSWTLRQLAAELIAEGCAPQSGETLQ